MNNTTVDNSKKRTRKRASLNERRAQKGWIFVLPFIIGLILVYIPVIIESISYSLADYKTIPAIQGGGYTLSWVGLDNFKKVFTLVIDSKTGETFLEMMFVDLGQQVVDIVAILMLSLFVAVLLNQKMMGRAAFRAIFFIPVVVGAGIMTKIDATSATILSTTSGMLEEIDTGSVAGGGFNLASSMDLGAMFSNLGFGGELVTIVSDLVSNIMNIVNRSGVQMLIFLAGLQSVSPSIYESCQMEGASAWEIFWKITLPMVSPMILVNAIYTIIDALTSSTNTVMSYISNIYNQAGGHELSAAMSWVYFLIVLAIIGAVAGLLSLFIFYQRRD